MSNNITPTSLIAHGEQLLADFVARNQELSASHGVDNFFEMCWRDDTHQIWVRCDGHAAGSLWPCASPGLVLGVDPYLAGLPDDADVSDYSPLAITLGPWVLAEGDDPEDLYAQMAGPIAKVVQFAAAHTHVVGFPCHDDCRCDNGLDVE